MVNAGFVQNMMQERSQQDRAVAPLITGPAGHADRLPPLSGESRHADASGKSRQAAVVHADHLAMAQALGWGEVAPFYIDLEAAGSGGAGLKTGSARGPSQGRSHAIRHHLVRAGGSGGDRVRGVVAGAAAGLGVPRAKHPIPAQASDLGPRFARCRELIDR